MLPVPFYGEERLSYGDVTVLKMEYKTMSDVMTNHANPRGAATMCMVWSNT